MIKLTEDEQRIASKIRQLKEAAGSHSPSIFTIAEELPELNIKVDACFLSNPYATELFLEYLKKELVDTNKLRDVLEFYPSQNDVVADVISKSININKENIFVGNGAIEVIQAVMHNFVGKKVIVNIPTFSSYYEFAREDTEVVYYQLDKKDDYGLVADKYLEFVKKENPDSVVIINPNNPNGGYLKYKDLRYILNNLKEIKNIIIDESFIHFAFEDEGYSLISATELYKEFSNVIVIKSMSKDFGIAGIRAGYGVMDKYKVTKLLKNGYLWNSSGLSEYFFRLYKRDDFFEEYEKVRKKYITEAQSFFKELSEISQIKVYPSMANFALIELLDGSTSADFVSKMLIKYGVYTRTGSDKIGLTGEFIRVAGRTKEENRIIINSIKDMFKNG
ncbi:aminotransferase [Aliarcobacter butzleri L354]|uniref:pyridoxal phosphate-dependent aminotransferase n=1 Tax=Aliarcobacter butzleri TaxID=28197 RepID=UPI000659FEEB|nr:histidinol-phosphate transaminase [Aliarcobacter butzleri]KLE11288.1 aminotransferase [Aliarcobacter butzleri L354]MCT7577395.1 histidinol-phosphate aminotransferase family protein [Aliarcobacter butzleri]